MNQIIEDALEVAESIITTEDYYSANILVNEALTALRTGKLVVVDGTEYERVIERLGEKIIQMTDAEMLLNEIANGNVITQEKAKAHFRKHYGGFSKEAPNDNPRN